MRRCSGPPATGAKAIGAAGQRDVVLLELQGDHLLAGHVGAHHQDAGDPRVGLQRLIDEIQVPPLDRPAGGALEQDLGTAADGRAAGAVDLVEQVEEELPLQVGQGLAHGQPDRIAMPDERAIGRVGQAEAVLRPGEHRHEAGRGVEQRGQVGRLGQHLALGVDALGEFVAGAEHALHHAVVVAHGRVREGEVGLLGIAVAQHLEDDVVHLDRLARVGGGDDRIDLVPDLVPDVAKALAHGHRMARAEHLGIVVVVERDLLRAPDDEDALARVEHHAHQRAQLQWPRGRHAQRVARPVERSHQAPRLAAAVEKLHRLRPGWKVASE